ncbi:MAG: DUF1338 domain-containing protein [Cyclobacteriaceae bacterium]|nr:DUF1338 domain-containing protein [Cyclobacteriaceae bacterium]
MNESTIDRLFDALWQEFVTTNPPAGHIHDLFVQRGEKVINDHVAFRTFDHPSIDLDVLARVFTKYGYVAKGAYHFKAKKLYARHYEHPDPLMPLVFISHLKTHEFPLDIQHIIQRLVEQVPEGSTEDESFIYSGRPWQVSHSDYQWLREVSEYAAWMAAFGFRVNHFTISINHLSAYSDIAQVNSFLKNNRIELNSAGGEVKGSPAVFLEQSSTVAYNKEVGFTDGKFTIPACYYEFALRYRKPDGLLFRGFVEGSADKIFESTNKGQDFNK